MIRPLKMFGESQSVSNLLLLVIPRNAVSKAPRLFAAVPLTLVQQLEGGCSNAAASRGLG